MKTCCFAGDKDNYILSGSDDFNLYMWRIPPEDSKYIILLCHILSYLGSNFKALCKNLKYIFEKFSYIQ